MAAPGDSARPLARERVQQFAVRVKAGMQTDMGALFLANSITLTPGTLTVNIDDETNDLFIHMINVPAGFEGRESIEAKEIFGLFDCPAWIRRIAE